MAVLRSRRVISKYEFEHTFTDLYRFTAQKTAAIPKRRKRWLCWKFDAKMNSLFNTIMEVNEGYFDRTTKKEAKEELLRFSMKKLVELEKPLMVLWNVEQYEIRRMVAWTAFIDKEMEVLNSMLEEPTTIERFQILDWSTIMKIKFLSNIFELHRIIHGKVAKAPNKYDDTYSTLLIDLIDEAMYSLAKANRRIPKTAAEYNERKKYISTAIGCLRKMQRPLIFYFNIMNYSEKALCEMSDKISDELKLLYALNKSDKERFGKLQ